MEIHLIVDTQNETARQHKIAVNEKLLKNLNLSDLVNKFESLLNRVKDLELYHLIEPVESAVCKLRRLQVLSQKLACDYYGGHPCANRNCCNDVDLTEKVKAAPCGCEYSECDFLCKSEEILDKSLVQCDNEFLGRTSSSSCVERCNPCECATDACGMKVKTRDCRLAAEQRRRGGERKSSDCDATKRTADCCEPPDDEGDIIVQRRFSNSRLEIHTNFQDMKFSINRENTVVQDTTFVKVRERNQAVSCNLSSDYTSSSGEFDSECSSDMIVFESNYDECLANNNERYNMPLDRLRVQNCGCSDGLDECMRSDAKLAGCGCGRRNCELAAAGEAVGDEYDAHQPMTCPCGCGDLTESPPARRRCPMRSNCKCENCGREIIDLNNLPITVSCKRNPFDYSRIAPRCRADDDDDDDETDTDEKISRDEEDAHDETIACSLE